MAVTGLLFIKNHFLRKSRHIMCSKEIKESNYIIGSDEHIPGHQDANSMNNENEVNEIKPSQKKKNVHKQPTIFKMTIKHSMLTKVEPSIGSRCSCTIFALVYNICSDVNPVLEDF